MIRHRLALLFAFLLLPSLLTAQSSIAQRVIHASDYRPTPGDVYTLVINYGGNPATGSGPRTETISLIVQADGEMLIPYVGSIEATTLSYGELQDTVTEGVRERLFAPFASLTLAAPALFDVFVWGAVESPGYHTLSSLNRLVEAIGVAGGTSSSGSRRRIEIENADGTSSFDLVGFAALGDESQNPYIRPGDRVFVPTAAAAMEVRGAVVRPGTYELVGDETMADVVRLAGGLLPTARTEAVSLSRLDDSGEYTFVPRLETPLQEIRVASGDVITIPSSTTSTELIVIEGAVYSGPAEEGTPRQVPSAPLILEVPWTPGISVLGVLERFGGPTLFAEPERSFIIRADSGTREPIPDLAELWSELQFDRDIALSPGDRLVIPMKRVVVAVGGSVIAPGAFPFTAGYDVGDYLELAGGIDPETGSVNRISFAEPDGTLTTVDISTPVPIGTTIFVDRNGLRRTDGVFSNIFTVTAWVTGILAVVTTVVEFIQIFSPDFP